MCELVWFDGLTTYRPVDTSRLTGNYNVTTHHQSTHFNLLRLVNNKSFCKNAKQHNIIEPRKEKKT
jgi:hypothetical protein